MDGAGEPHPPETAAALPRARTVDGARGETVVRELWTHSLKPGEVDFPGARMLLVLQMRLQDDGTSTQEFRS
jgi:hypothetical protein